MPDHEKDNQTETEPETQPETQPETKTLPEKSDSEEEDPPPPHGPTPVRMWIPELMPEHDPNQWHPD